jgi:hypothetical protein
VEAMAQELCEVELVNLPVRCGLTGGFRMTLKTCVAQPEIAVTFSFAWCSEVNSHKIHLANSLRRGISN